MHLEQHLHPGLDPDPLIATSPADADVLVDALLRLDEPRRVAYLRDDEEMVHAFLAVDRDHDRGVLYIRQPEPAYPVGDTDGGAEVVYHDEYDAVPVPAAWHLPLVTVRTALRQLLAGQLLPPAIAWRDGLGEAL